MTSTTFSSHDNFCVPGNEHLVWNINTCLSPLQIILNHLLMKTQSYSIQTKVYIIHRTLVNSVREVLEWLQQKLLLIFKQTHAIKFPRLLCIALYRTKNFTSETFMKVPRKGRTSKFSKVFKHFQNYRLFPNVVALQNKISKFNKISLQEKCFPGEIFSEIFGKKDKNGASTFVTKSRCSALH